MTSAHLIARARATEASRAGVRVKIRLPDELHRRAQAAAADCRDDLAEWANKACRLHQKSGVRSQESEPIAPIAPPQLTRCSSTPVWLRAPAGMPPDQIRAALAAAAERSEATRRPPPTVNLLPPGALPGVHYILETNPE